MGEQNSHAASCVIGDIMCVKVVRNAGYRVSFSNGRTSHGFIYVKGGSIRCTFLEGDRDAADVSASGVLFIPKGTKYVAEYLGDGTDAAIVNFDIIYGKLPKCLSCVTEIDLSDAQTLFDSIADAVRHVGLGDEGDLYCAFRAYELLWRAVKSLEASNDRTGRISPALAELHSHFNEQREISYYAELCYMSETGFRRHFKNALGVSPVEYRNRLRLDEARRLIYSGEYTVEESARAVGFSNISFFCREFKKTFGKTPLGKRRADKKL